MPRVVPAAKKLAVGMAAATALSLGTGGLAGAATPASPSSPSPTPSAAGSHHRNFDCSRAPRVLARIQKVESQIKAGLPRLHAAEQKAKAAGRTRLADRIERRIDRLQNPRTTVRLDRVSKAIEAKCHVPAPSGSGSSSTTTPTAAGTTGATST